MVEFVRIISEQILILILFSLCLIKDSFKECKISINRSTIPPSRTIIRRLRHPKRASWLKRVWSVCQLSLVVCSCGGATMAEPESLRCSSVRNRGGVQRVEGKLRASVEKGDYYEAHQMYRTLYFRWVWRLCSLVAAICNCQLASRPNCSRSFSLSTLVSLLFTSDWLELFSDPPIPAWHFAWLDIRAFCF